MILIDPPVSQFSSVEDIRKWLEDLKAFSQDEVEVKDAITEAKEWLFKAEIRDKTRAVLVQ